MRIRTIKPEFWHNEELAKTAFKSRLLAIGLLNFSDDEGYFNANEDLVRSTIFPYDSGSVTGHLLELSGIGYIEIHDCKDGKRIGKVVNFVLHQYISHPKPSTLRPIFEIPVSVQEGSGNITITLQSGKEGKGKEKSYPEELDISNSSSSKKEEKETPPTSPSELEFEECWKLYPNKSGKAKALLAYKKARKQGVTYTIVSEGIKRYMESVLKRRANGFKKLNFKDGDTWFHNQCWMDENTSVEPCIKPRIEV